MEGSVNRKGKMRLCGENIDWLRSVIVSSQLHTRAFIRPRLDTNERGTGHDSTDGSLYYPFILSSYSFPSLLIACGLQQVYTH